MGDPPGRVEFAEITPIDGDRFVGQDHPPGEVDLAVMLIGLAGRDDPLPAPAGDAGPLGERFRARDTKPSGEGSSESPTALSPPPRLLKPQYPGVLPPCPQKEAGDDRTVIQITVIQITWRHDETAVNYRLLKGQRQAQAWR